jgi:hypothetical protein
MKNVFVSYSHSFILLDSSIFHFRELLSFIEKDSNKIIFIIKGNTDENVLVEQMDPYEVVLI